MKNKRQIAIVVLLVALLGIIGYTFLQPNKSTIQSTMSDFSIQDTSSVDKIFIANMRGDQVLLERLEGSNWRLNGKYVANIHTVNIFLETAKLMTVKAPVAKARYDKTIRDLATIGIKVEIYQGGSSPSKVYYVGTPNQNHTGNYMKLEDADLPYLVHIEGFRGFLSPRFSPYEVDWRSKSIFKLNPKEIAQVRVTSTENEDAGFLIKQTPEGEIELYNPLNLPVNGWEKGYVLEYLDRFRIVNFESWEETKSVTFIDSVMNSTPLETYELTTHDGVTTKIETFLKPLKGGMDLEGNPIDYDQDRMYAVINEQEFVVIQYYVFDPLNQTMAFFYNQ